jgi:hypothetical protein
MSQTASDAHQADAEILAGVFGRVIQVNTLRAARWISVAIASLAYALMHSFRRLRATTNVFQQEIVPPCFHSELR